MTTLQADPTASSKRSPDGAQFFKDLDIEFLVHELKDPIAIIETGVRTLLERREKFGMLTSRQERTLKRLLRNSRKARGMIYNLLEIGRSETGNYFYCEFYPSDSVMRALADAFETIVGGLPDTGSTTPPPATKQLLGFFSEQNIHIAITPQAAGTKMFQDEIKFRQIAGNLIKNALHYRSNRLDIQLDSKDGNIVLEVCDDGPGIDRKHHETIFNRYAQVDECSLLPRKGHGLGLAGARIMARCLGGDIAVASQKGTGSTFRLLLPLRHDLDR